MAKKRSSGRRTPQEGVREKASGAVNSPGTPSGPRADPTSGSKRESTTNVFASGLVDGGDGDHGDSPGNPLVLLADRVWRSRWLAPALLGFVALVWFGPTLVTNSRLAFRDVSHFYTPLYEYISTRLAQRELPLWNPLIVTGTPIVGDNTSAVFYPPRLVFALGMSTETAMTWYCAMHMILAGCGAAYAARRHGCQGTLAWLAGIAYACSAPVIEQYSNPPFLVGAAWLPWGVSGMFQTISGGSRRAIALTALALAMPVLAGDPQTTMHTLLIGGTYWTVLQIKRRWLKRSASTAPNLSQVRGVAPEFVRRSASGRDSAVHVYTLPLVLACGISLMAAFIQVWPTLQWSTHSGRNIEAPAGIARVLAGPVASSTDRRWYQEPEPNTHADLIYNFSIGPWMAVDVFAPNILGQLKPISGRMSRLWATSEVFWNSSLYCGGFIAIAALCAFTRLRLGRWHVMALLAFLLSLGRFGFVPLIQLIGRWRNEEWLQGYDPALFTPYWWLVTCVPAYASFRYPAKWMPVFALGMAVGAVAWLREATQQDLRRFRYCALGIAILFATVALMSYSSLVLQYANKAKNVGATIDQFYGPMQMSVAFNWLRWACLHAFLLSMFLWWRFARTERVGVAEDSGLPGQLALLLACEMAIAGTAWVDRLPRYREPLIGISEEDVAKLKREGIVDSPAILRVLDDKRQFGPWLSTWSPNRFIEVERNEQRTLVALWNLTHDLVNINAVRQSRHGSRQRSGR